MSYSKVNAHLHTPYSFSAFQDVNDALDRALDEGVSVVGINDFYTARGYSEWAEGCKARNIYPLFNIELIGLNEEDQKAGLRVNDPANPGRTYISGKGLSYPFKLSEPFATKLSDVLAESDKQVVAMCHKLNAALANLECGFSLDIDWIRNELTKGMIRERHLAKALRIKAYEYCNDSAECINKLFEKLFNGKSLKSKIDDLAAVENEIRGNLLKSGGAAYVAETPEAFLPVTDVCNIILAAGGIPTYPFLADDANGGYTDFEADLQNVAEVLTKRGFHSVEFISTRNDVALLEKYASYLHNQGFVVTLGSEHNTPAMEPIELFARNSTPLTDELMRINYEGACVIAAHQHLISQGLDGYLDEHGNADRASRDEFIKLGDEVIKAATIKQEL